ncbi:MAG: anti-sigma factor, partial [Rhodoferax sp.]|nr:anti-sigma factor [Rhodoferax sp.]
MNDPLVPQDPSDPLDPAMDSRASSPSGHAAPLVSHDELHRLVDGRLAPAEAAAVESRLLRDPAAAALRADWQAQRDRLRGLHASLLNEPLPPTLADAVRRTTQSRQQTDAWWRWGGMAAGVLLAFGAGWWGRGMAPAGGSSAASAVLAARDARATPAAFARQAVVAHVVYAPEVRHPVEVAAAQQEHLVQWLSKRLGRPLKLPQLSSEGYE